MTQDEIIEMARQTGWHDALLDVSFVLPMLTDFAKLIAAKAAAKEREACAKVCEEYSAIGKIEEFDRGWLACAKNIAAVIRARGKA
jgi:hypothetical protein